MTQNPRRKLFLSLPATLSAMEKGLVTKEDLAAGLFFFDFWKPEQVFNPMTADVEDQHGQYLQRLAARCSQSYASLLAHLKQASADGRVAWCPAITESSTSKYPELNALLTRHGFEALQAAPDRPYSMHVVLELCHDLDVVTFEALLTEAAE